MEDIYFIFKFFFLDNSSVYVRKCDWTNCMSKEKSKYIPYEARQGLWWLLQQHSAHLSSGSLKDPGIVVW